MINVYFVTFIYLIIFLFGVFGNLTVLGAMIYSRTRCIPTNNRHARSERSRIFVFMLATSDLTVLITIPFTLWQILKLNWSFGSLCCKLHSAIDFSGKSMSLVLLTGMAIERYLIIGTRWKYTASPIRIILIPIAIGIIFGVALPMIPQVMYTNLFTINVERNGQTLNETVCLSVMPDEYVTLYTIYTFVCSFLFPLLVMSCCYVMLMRHVRKKFRERSLDNRSPSSSIRVHRPKYLCNLTRSICQIAVFHFSCWMSFWFFLLVPIYASTLGLKLPDSDWYNNAKLYANMLPYVNSAGNCLFYAFLNRDIRKHLWRPSSRLRSGYTVTALQSVTTSFNNPECHNSN